MKKFFLILTGLLTVILIGSIFLHRNKLIRPASSVEALGLRGNAKVSRPLSKVQVERLQAHFLDVPVINESSAGDPSVAQVNSINKFNATQRP